MNALETESQSGLQEPDRPPQANRPSLSIVIPAYNEDRRLVPTLEKLRDYASKHDCDWEVIVVDDGSRDDTHKSACDADPGPLQLRILSNPSNRGKGYSVRRGMLEAQGRRMLMCDADLSMPIDQLPKLLQALDDGFDVAIASRDMPDSVLDPPQPWSRRIIGAVFRIIRSSVILPGIRDSQCGFKCFERQVARKIFTAQSLDGFAFDCEVLALAQRFGHCIAEIGVTWRNDRDSRVRITDPFSMLLNLLTIRWRLRERVFRK